MKFLWLHMQIRLFKLPPHYQSLWSRGEQDPEFWKEVALAFMNNKYNTETSRNRYSIKIYQREPLHKPYFIAIDNWGQVIIGPNKKIVATYVVGELEVLIWIYGDINPEKGVLLWSISQGCIIKISGGYNNTISCAEVVSVSTSCSKCSNLTVSSCLMTWLLHELHIVSSCITCIYSIDTILYSYTLPFIQFPLLFFKSLPKYNLSSSLRL